jgi:ketosteroid isomerase-like protein
MALRQRQRSVSALVRKYFVAYQAHDRKTLDTLLADDFTFSSPRDDHIDKQAYFVNCAPKPGEYRAFKIEKIFEVGNEGFVRYTCAPQCGTKFRNTEYFRIRRGKIREVDVYFGRNLPA